MALALASMGVVSAVAAAATTRARRDARRRAAEEKRREMRARFARERAGMEAGAGTGASAVAVGASGGARVVDSSPRAAAPRPAAAAAAPRPPPRPVAPPRPMAPPVRPPRVEDYYPPNYDDLYPAVSTSKGSNASSATTERNELRRARRKEQRAKYFHLVGSRQHGKSRDERERVIAEFERKVSSPEPMEWLFDTASGSPFDAAVYGYAAKSLWRERYLDALAGDGAFSDVFLTHQSSKVASQRFGAGDAVLKCSNPFPGVVNGGAVGDGYRMGKVEATTLASVPTHPAIVRIYAAFLEKSRNESYLLLSAAGKDAHTMREDGELTPRDVRSALRRVLHGVRHCHSHGVVHRDIKAGNVLLSPTPANARVKTKYRATLIDFGVAKQAILADQSHCSMYGTPGVPSAGDVARGHVGKSRHGRVR